MILLSIKLTRKEYMYIILIVFICQFRYDTKYLSKYSDTYEYIRRWVRKNACL